MNWWRGLFRLWVGLAVVVTGLFLFGSVSAALYDRQTNDASEMLAVAAICAAIGLFGAWVLRGFKGGHA